MNQSHYKAKIYRWGHRLSLKIRWIGSKGMCKSFGCKTEQNQCTIEQIYVINLDRQVPRWHNIQQELGMINDRYNRPLRNLTKRVSAIDSRYMGKYLNCQKIQPTYSLGDHLFVEPNPQLSIDYANDSQPIAMTRQEVAIALSHISVWNLIASSDNNYTLILEDDIFFRRGFVRIMDRAWAELNHSMKSKKPFDMLYVSYEDAKTGVEKVLESETLFKPIRGLWCLSGYILSNKGARKLLSLLPVRGPVDIWINQQFKKLDVYATRHSIISQRRDFKSDNLYSILPVLSKVGVLTDEESSVFKGKKLPKPIFVFGEQESGYTSLSMALSMLGYRCCSDINDLPKKELDALLCRKKSRVFDAFVNVGSLFGHAIALARTYSEARFIITVSKEEELIYFDQDLMVKGKRFGLTLFDPEGSPNISVLHYQLNQVTQNILVLSNYERDKWSRICEFLGCDPPNGEFPTCKDQRQRQLSIKGISFKELPKFSKLKFDPSPWIAPLRRDWQGLPSNQAIMDIPDESEMVSMSDRFQTFDNTKWMLLNDTFPSNLALFDPKNFLISNGNAAKLNLNKEFSGVREYKSASISSRNSYLYGCFTVVIKPTNVSGLITGIFLHRNSPRQEIDIEFLGKDTRKMLVNVFYNPGGDGARLDFGYRGTPVLIDLGFDASAKFHRYEIAWSPTAICWYVDGKPIYRRENWEPTPIPHLPMRLFVNLWPTRSEKLAGKLSDESIPTYSQIKSINLRAWPAA